MCSASGGVNEMVAAIVEQQQYGHSTCRGVVQCFEMLCRAMWYYAWSDVVLFDAAM